MKITLDVLFVARFHMCVCGKHVEGIMISYEALHISTPFYVWECFYFKIGQVVSPKCVVIFFMAINK